MEGDTLDAALIPTEPPLDASPESTLRKGKRRPEDDIVDEVKVEEQNLEAPPRAKRSKRAERPPVEPRNRPLRERRQSSYSLSLGFLDDKAFGEMETRSSKIEQRRAAFYDTQSYHGEVVAVLPLNKMAVQEKDAFPRCADNSKLAEVYLRHRKGILEKHAEVAPEYLEFGTYVGSLTQNGYEMSPGERRMAQRIWKFLRVNNRINPDSKQHEPFELESPEASDEEYAEVAPNSPSTTEPKPKRGRGKAAPDAPSPDPHPPTVEEDPDVIAVEHIETKTELTGDEKLDPTNDPTPSSSKDTSLKPSKPKSVKSSSNPSTSSSSSHHSIPSHPNDDAEAPIKAPKPRAAKSTGSSSTSASTGPSSAQTASQSDFAPPLRRPASRAPRRRKDDGPIPSTWTFGPLIPSTSNVLDASSLRVCIIGAGISGLAAAQCLHQHGVKNVQVLEARSRLGGRICSINANNTIIETGAQFVQDHHKDPILDICQQLNLSLPSTPAGTCHALDHLFSGLPAPFPILAPLESIERGEAVPFKIDEPELTAERLKELESEVGAAPLANTAAESTPCDADQGPVEPLSSGLIEPKDNRGKPADDTKMDITDDSNTTASPAETHSTSSENIPVAVPIHSLGEEVTQEPTFRWRDLMTKGSFASDMSSVEDLYSHEYATSRTVALEGLSEVIRNLAIGVDVRLGCAVEAINYNSVYRNDTVLVRYADANNQLRNETFDVVLVTVPLGVLKAGTLHFSPELPATKLEAINRVQVGHQNKVILFFNQVFWNQGEKRTEAHRVVWESEKLGVVVLSSPVIYGTKPILQMIWSGPAATAMDTVDPKVCVDAIVAELKSAFAGGMGEIALEGFVWVPWSADAHCLGAHSFVPLGEHPTIRNDLAEPIHCGRIGFAGEHTHQAHASTIHGAFESGIREARRIIESFTQLKVAELVYPFNQEIGSELRTELPWKQSTEEQEMGNDLLLASLPKALVRLTPMEMDLSVDVV